jgi:hypothetical protein
MTPTTPQTTRRAGWQHFISRFPDTRLLWDAPAANGHLRAYALHGQIVIIHDYAGDNGWTAYIDPFTTLDVSQTLEAIAVHCAPGTS